MIFYTILFREFRKVAISMFDRVKELSDKRGLSLTELAQKMEWSDKAIYNWKTSKPSIDKVEKVADFFGVSTDYLLGRTDKQYWELTDKDEKNIQLQLEEMIEDLSTVGLFSKEGEEMDDNTRELLIMSLENSLRIARQEAKRRFTPKKYRGGE